MNKRDSLRKSPTVYSLRSGFGLLDMAAVLAGMSILISLCAIVLQWSMKTLSDTLTAFQLSQQLQMLVEQLRMDSQRAIGIQGIDSLVLVQDHGSQIEYRVLKSSVQRSLLDGNEREIGKQVWLLPLERIDYELDRSGQFPLIRFQLQFSSNSQPAILPLEIVSRISVDSLEELPNAQ